MKFTKGLRFKLLILPVSMQVFSMLIFIGAAMLSSNKLITDDNIKVAESVSRTIQIVIEEWRVGVLSYAKIEADRPSPVFAQAIKDGDTEAIIEFAKDAFAYSGCDGMTFTDMEGNALARVQAPDRFGDNIKSSLAIADALEGKSVSYVYPTLNNGFSITAGVPIKDGNEQIGVLFLSKRLDKDDIISELKSMTGCEIVLYQGLEPVITSLPGEPTMFDNIDKSRETALNSGTVIDVIKFDDKPATWGYTPISGRDGSVVGTILAINVSSDGGWVIPMWLCLFFGLCAICIPILFAIVSKITKHFGYMARGIGQIGSEGDLNFPPDVMASAQTCSAWENEIGIVARAAGGLIAHLMNLEKSLAAIASGDLTTEIKVLGKKDVIGNAVKELVKRLKDTFYAINQTTEQVHLGAGQISSGSQALASGSVQQASAIAQLSETIAEISGKAKEKTDMAEKAANLANDIMKNAENSSEQMKQMIDAVNEINSANQSINQVIKVIDDIAFQTNILALNAAVEAARAGQHGKGFAVVAEEVRNLAAKSAESAKNTNELIANSVKKARLGAEIAEKTSESLKLIVDGINESNKINTKIAQTSEEQSVAISQINVAVNEVTMVVQQNSATAQQSAASSQEMSGQASTLESLISQFKLEDRF
ncbi:MAG: methyl-accepting chemotaxis protein [Oscillospiraceae bacterium]|nr:methyl-accepting chemotaxis protein [Oscillospiraceae bacterium]